MYSRTGSQGSLVLSALNLHKNPALTGRTDNATVSLGNGSFEDKGQEVSLEPFYVRRGSSLCAAAPL